MEFEITSSPSSTVIFSGALAALMLTIGILFVWFAFSASHLSASIENAALRINAPIYGRSIALSNLELSTARVVNLDDSPDLRPRIRSNGIGLPGYAVGWFRLKNGEKALAAITARNEVLYMRTTEGYSLLLSLKKPATFLKLLTSRMDRNA